MTFGKIKSYGEKYLLWGTLALIATAVIKGRTDAVKGYLTWPLAIIDEFKR